MSWFVLACIVGCLIGYPLIAELVARREERSWHESGKQPLSTQHHDRAIATQAATPSPRKKWLDVVVHSVRDESPDCRSFLLNSADGAALPRFAGGQFLTVRCPSSASGKSANRCYSLSSGPNEPNYRITVKRVPGGTVSNWLHDHVSKGDRLEIKPPGGKFHLDPETTDRPLVLIAAGIGITPMMSMLMHSLEATPSRPVRLFYQLQNDSNAPFLKILRHLSKSLADRGCFELFVSFSRPASEASGVPGTPEAAGATGAAEHFGRLDASVILKKPGLESGDFMICGPDRFMSSIAEGLVDHGVPATQVSYESFGGKSGGVGAIAVADPGAASISHEVKLITEDRSLQWSHSKGSLLDLVEEEGIEVESSCRSGNCGMCVQRLVRGSVDYENPIECEIEEGEVVLCVARPTSDIALELSEDLPG